MSKIIIKQKKNINSFEFNSIEEYEASSEKNMNEYEFNVSSDYFAYFFRKFYKKKDIADSVKGVLDTIDDKIISELCSVLVINSGNLICMNNLFDWESSLCKECKLIETLGLELKDGKLSFPFAFLYILDELVKSYNTYRLEKKIISADIIMNESDIFPELSKSDISKNIKCEVALLENENVFCNISQPSTDSKRFMFLKDMDINKTNYNPSSPVSEDIVVEQRSSFNIEFVEKSQFVFDIYFSNPFSNKGGYVDMFVVIPNDKGQEYYQIFLNSSSNNSFLQIRKTNELVENILVDREDTFEFNFKEYYITETDMNRINGTWFNEDDRKYLNVSVWETISNNSSIKDVFEFSKFLEKFLVNLNRAGIKRYDYKVNSLSIEKMEGKIMFNLNENKKDELVSRTFFELNFENVKNLNFELYESAWYFTPVLLNRLKFINILQNVHFASNQINLDHLNIIDFQSLSKDSTADDVRKIYKSNYDRLMQCSETKRLTLAYELLDILIPEQHYQLTCPIRTELQLLHFGLLGDSAEVIKYIVPALDFQIADCTLNKFDKHSKKELALSIGSNHYSKLSSPYSIKFVDNILLALTKQVNQSKENPSTSELIYKETIQKLSTKLQDMTPKNMYDQFTILTAIINLNNNEKPDDELLDMNQITLKKTTGRPRKNELSNMVEKTDKKSPGRPRKDDKLLDMNEIILKKTPGRPRKDELLNMVEKTAKKSPGRPRKDDSIKKNQGRPRKTEENTKTSSTSKKRKRDEQELSSNKRGRGRPKKSWNEMFPNPTARNMNEQLLRTRAKANQPSDDKKKN